MKKLGIFLITFCSFLLFGINVKAANTEVLGVYEEGTNVYDFISNIDNYPVIYDKVIITNGGAHTSSNTNDYIFYITYSNDVTGYIRQNSSYRNVSFVINNITYIGRPYNEYKNLANNFSVYTLYFDTDTNTYNWVEWDENTQVLPYFDRYSLKLYFSSEDLYYHTSSSFEELVIGDLYQTANLDLNITPSINFTSENNTVTVDDVEKVVSVDLTIDYGVIDNDKYIYIYRYDDENYWHTYYLTDSSSINLNIDKNRNVIVRIVDKETYEAIDTKTFAVVNIDYDLDINFLTETLRDDFGNVYQTNVTIDYDSLNRDLFDYQYITDNLEYWVSLDEDKSSIMIQNRDNINIIARIVDKSTGDILKTSTYKIVQNIDKPKISFKSFNNLKYLGGADAFNNAQTIVESVDLTIDYGLMDNDTYIYMWKYYDEDTWHTHYLLKNSININIIKNTTIIAQVVNKSDNSVVTSATYTITTIYDEVSTDSINGIFDYIEDNNNTNSVFSSFSNIWESFKTNNKIYTYLMLVITTSIIILVLKSMGK